MRQADITFMAYSMARSVAERLPQRDDERHFMALHAYALNRRDVDQARQLPSAEVLARKHGEISGTRFAWPSLPAAPRQVRLFWAAFRGAIETLEPFRDETTPAMFPPLEAVMALHTVDAPANPLPGRQQAEDEEPLFQEVRLLFAQDDEEKPDLRFIEAETIDGKSINAGTWLDRGPSGLHRLALTVHTSDIRARERPHTEDGAENAAGDRAIQELIDDGAITVTTTTEMVDAGELGRGNGHAETRVMGGTTGGDMASASPAAPPSTDPGPAPAAADSSTSRKPSRKKTAAE